MKSSRVHFYICLALLALGNTSYASQEFECPGSAEGKLHLYWGDLHVHTSFSLDAYVFGTTANPAQAYAFAKGGERILADKTTRIKLQRPLDFAAVTDHAETFDIMYLCTDPTFSKSAYCSGLRDLSGTKEEDSLNAFRSYLMPLIASEPPQTSPLCQQAGVDCGDAAKLQWRRTQQYANEANSPCEFTAFIGNEWSATPNRKHWHRNLIFSGTSVTPTAIDYLRYPSPEAMWRELEKQCDPAQGCDVIAIPHNTNFSEGGGFDVETSDENQLYLRSKYERLIEIHQSKGNSECLAENWDDANSDCGFEPAFLTKETAERARKEPKYLAELNRSYTRNILSRGLLAYQQSGKNKVNPLQLGIIGSTDGHIAAPGAADETDWKGDAWGGGDAFKQRRLKRIDYNPGGLVAVWSRENTRSSLFQSLKRRETYATSGTRIKLRFLVDTTTQDDPCSSSYDFSRATSMGGSFNQVGRRPAPRFSVLAAMDAVPLGRIEIIKGTLENQNVIERVISIEENNNGFSDTCRNWSDPEFDPSQPAYWYARVLELPSPRWSKSLCQELSNCEQVPGANRMIQERAWSSPIWYLP